MKKGIVFLTILSLLVVSLFAVLPSICAAGESTLLYRVTFEGQGAGTILSKFGNLVGEVVEWPKGSGNHALKYTVDSSTRTGNGVHPSIIPKGIGQVLEEQGQLPPGGSLTLSMEYGSDSLLDAYLYPCLITNGSEENYFESGVIVPEYETFSKATFELTKIESTMEPEKGNGGVLMIDEGSIPEGTVLYLDNVSMTWNGNWKPVSENCRISYLDTDAVVEETGWTGSSETILYGDCNNDTFVDMKDVLSMRKYIAIPTEPISFLNADVWIDKSVDMKDVLLLRKYLAKAVDKLGVYPDSPTTTTRRSTTTTTNRTSPPDAPTYFDYKTDETNGSLGTWWWDCSSATSSDKYLPRLEFLQQNHVTEIYIWFNQNSMSQTQMEQFVLAAKAHGMRVAWLAGDVSYILPGNTGYATVYNAFKKYQENAPQEAKLYAMHLDVEPHQNSTLTDEQKWQYYADFAHNACVQCHQDGYKIEWDIPFWTDDRMVTYNGKANVHLTEELMKESDTVVLMSYRDTAKAMVPLGDYEFSLENSTQCKVVLGAETLNLGTAEAFCTFNEEGKGVLYTEMLKVFDLVSKKDLQYGYGMAVHHMESWKNLKQ